MDDIRRQDLRLFVRELFSPWRIALFGVLAVVAYARLTGSIFPLPLTLTAVFAIILTAISTAYSASVLKRFTNRRHAQMWDGCKDRLARFEEVLKKMRGAKVATLEEMPRTIRRVAESIYYALRRADIISTEVARTEQELFGTPPTWAAHSNDPQSQELYRQADKNIAEYRQHYAGVMAGVQRTEAQSAVFMTTVDTLRMKMLGYRLMERSPEMNSLEFLEALQEAKLQLQSIDLALDELELGPYPKMIASTGPVSPQAATDKRP